MRARTQAHNQTRSLVSTAPNPVREELRHLSLSGLLERAASNSPDTSFGTKIDVVSLTKWTLSTLARRAIEFELIESRAAGPCRMTRQSRHPWC
jgi:hypothetical protein